MTPDCEVLIIGGGHAGCEAALASARLGVDTLLLTMNPDRIGAISCNPAVGGIAKGQLVREIDAMGGMMGLAADANAIQFRLLNSAKGPAVRSPRAQIDRWAYQNWVKSYVESQPRLRVEQDEAVAIETRGGAVTAVATAMGRLIRCRSVVIAAGTFSRALLHLGERSWPGGRNGEPSADHLSRSLEKLGLPLFRLRTDTCPRIDSRTVDFSRLTPEPGDERPTRFSFTEEAPVSPSETQIPCYSAWTNRRTAEVVRRTLDRSPAITGWVAGEPPRYCPNFELKVSRFPEKTRHHLFIEPEGRNSVEMYLNGFSTSVPPDTQEDMIRTVEGLEKAVVVRRGYAVEYDAVRSTVLKATYEAKAVGGLFLAGQINGTSGYEEAAAQGLLAGANAALSASRRPPLTLGRDSAYLGVLADDLTIKGTDEPYRLFTSRAEYRLVLRHDNADRRLTPLAAAVGLVDAGRLERVRELEGEIRRAGDAMRGIFDAGGNDLEHFLRRPEISWADAGERLPELAAVSPRAAEQLEIEAKYAGYISRQETQIRQLERHRARIIPVDFSYAALSGLSREAREKLDRVRPGDLDQAMRIPGVGPADAALLAMALERSRRGEDGAKG